jgi:hypothetical protein
VSSLRLLFYVTLMLLIGFTFSFPRDVGFVNAVPWIVSFWLLWGLGVSWLRSRGRGHRP